MDALLPLERLLPIGAPLKINFIGWTVFSISTVSASGLIVMEAGSYVSMEMPTCL